MFRNETNTWKKGHWPYGIFVCVQKAKSNFNIVVKAASKIQFSNFISYRSSEEPSEKPSHKVSLDTSYNNTSGGSADLLGLGIGGGDAPQNTPSSNMNGNGFSSEAPTNNLNKWAPLENVILYEKSNVISCRFPGFIARTMVFCTRMIRYRLESRQSVVQTWHD